MLVSSELDLNWYFQLIFSCTAGLLAFLYFIKNTASRYFEAVASSEGDQQSTTNLITGSNINLSIMPGVVMDDNSRCFICGQSSTKKCSRCKAVRYCSQKCQESHWKSGHKKDCKVVDQNKRRDPAKTILSNDGSKACDFAAKTSSSIALVPPRGATKVTKQPKEVLFPYGEFLKLFNWDKLGFPPCGLRNCGNSCFANVVLQCLTFTRPLAGFLLEKGHRSECHLNDWCFLCEFQSHIERASSSSNVISPMNILSRLPNIGGTLGHGSQEDAHEFMRFAIDTMQLVFLDEFGGEKAVDPSSQETTLIQHIFGGHLQSQVICAKCNNVSNQYENMMDLTVEIQGDAESLEKCLDQFTVKECLHGENKYKCDGCNDYVKAWKRLTIKRAPNILTIALKRFQSGRFGKLNKRVSFPETLDLSPYMSETGDGSDVYRLYGVVVHVDMLNASYFGHYVCYIKDFHGKWYRIDDWKVVSVDLQDVLSQGAYMLLYSRVCPRPSCLKFPESVEKEKQMANEKMVSCKNEETTFISIEDVATPSENHMVLPSDMSSKSKAASVSGCRAESNSLNDQSDIMVARNGDPCSNGLMRETCSIGNSSSALRISSQPVGKCREDTQVSNISVSSMEEPSCYTKDSSVAFDHEVMRVEYKDNVAIPLSSTVVNEIDRHPEGSCATMDCESLRQELEDTGVLKYESNACLGKVSEGHIKGHMNAEMFLPSQKISTELVHAVNSVGTGIRIN